MAEVFHTRACRLVQDGPTGYVCDGRYGCYVIATGKPVWNA